LNSSFGEDALLQSFATLRNARAPGNKKFLISISGDDVTGSAGGGSIAALREPTMVYGITDITTFILGTIVIILLPGPNSLYVMSVASRWGVAAGYRGAAGIFVGDAMLMTLSATGVASLLQTSPALFMTFKVAGAAYLAWLGVGLARAAFRGWRQRGDAPAQPAQSAQAPVDAAHPFRSALAISLVNPKAILFFVSFFIQFVAPDYEHPGLSFVILAAIVQFFSALYLSLLIFGGARLAAGFRRRRRLAALATGGVGGLFIAFGVKLAGVSAQ
jgi:leucine efflux protein